MVEKHDFPRKPFIIILIIVYQSAWQRGVRTTGNSNCACCSVPRPQFQVPLSLDRDFPVDQTAERQFWLSALLPHCPALPAPAVRGLSCQIVSLCCAATLHCFTAPVTNLTHNLTLLALTYFRLRFHQRPSHNSNIFSSFRR